MINFNIEDYLIISDEEDWLFLNEGSDEDDFVEELPMKSKYCIVLFNFIIYSNDYLI